MIFSNFIKLKSNIFNLLSRLLKGILAFLILTILFVRVAFGQDLMSVKMWDGLDNKGMKVVRDVAILVDNKNYNAALKKTELMKLHNKHLYQALFNIVLYNKYGDPDSLNDITFSDISRFIADNGYYPNIGRLKDNLENLIVAKKIPYATYEPYFMKSPPKSFAIRNHILEEKLVFLNSYSGKDFANQEQRIADIRSSIADIWVNYDLNAEESEEFIKKYGSQLSQVDHLKKIEKLLWQEKFDSAKNILYLVDKDYQILFSAVIKINESGYKYVRGSISAVPRRLRNSELLNYARLIAYHNAKKEGKVISLLQKMPAINKKPVKWWKLRHLYGRELLKTQDYQDSYDIISNHGLDAESYQFSEAEWLAGWIALRFLDDPKSAVRHFTNMYNNVSYPISVSRASYWLGMSFESLDDSQKAMEWYKTASAYPTYFYGQVAMHKYRMISKNIELTNFSLPTKPEISSSDSKIISYKMALRTAYLLILMNDKSEGLKIIKNIIDGLNSKGKIAAIISLVEEIGDEELTHKLYRYANRKNVFFINKQFKIIDQIRDIPNSALIHALIKQESGFARSALSSAGAVGFMQIMPDTAKQVAKKLRIKYSSDGLSRDIEYNIKIGSYYINSLLKKFDNSKVLAIASYNAGPNSAKRWVDEFYDPRKYNDTRQYDGNDLDKVIDWIELVTYGETRNYIQRVMENLLVYKYLMSYNDLT